MQDVGVRERIDVERSHRICLLFGIPLETADSNLECKHALAIVPKLLVPLFNSIIVINLIIEADREPRTLGVNRYEVSSVDGFANQLELRLEVVVQYFHS